MSTPTKDQVHNTTDADAMAIKNAANQIFIQEADAAIANQVALGKYSVTLTLSENVNAQDIYNYYNNLGYRVSAIVGWPQGQPAQLFGAFWVNFWTSNPLSPNNNPDRVTINWQ